MKVSLCYLLLCLGALFYPDFLIFGIIVNILNVPMTVLCFAAFTLWLYLMLFYMIKFNGNDYIQNDFETELNLNKLHYESKKLNYKIKNSNIIRILLNICIWSIVVIITSYLGWIYTTSLIIISLLLIIHIFYMGEKIEKKLNKENI